MFPESSYAALEFRHCETKAMHVTAPELGVRASCGSRVSSIQDNGIQFVNNIKRSIIKKSHSFELQGKFSNKDVCLVAFNIPSTVPNSLLQWEDILKFLTKMSVLQSLDSRLQTARAADLLRFRYPQANGHEFTLKRSFSGFKEFPMRVSSWKGQERLHSNRRFIV